MKIEEFQSVQDHFTGKVHLAFMSEGQLIPPLELTWEMFEAFLDELTYEDVKLWAELEKLFAIHPDRIGDLGNGWVIRDALKLRSAVRNGP